MRSDTAGHSTHLGPEGKANDTELVSHHLLCGVGVREVARLFCSFSTEVKQSPYDPGSNIVQLSVYHEKKIENGGAPLTDASA